MAAKSMRGENSGNTLQATALVHEVFLKLVDVNEVGWKDKAHFFAVSANIMRRILVDRARAKWAAKKGGAALRLNLEDAPEIASVSRDREMVAIDDALDVLTQVDPRKAKVIELRFFGGQSLADGGTRQALAAFNVPPRNLPHKIRFNVIGEAL